MEKHTIQYILKINGFELSEEEVTDFWRHMKNNEKVGVYYTVEDIIAEYKKLRG